MKKSISFLVLSIFSITILIAQDKYWISFKDKDVKNYSYENFLSPQAIANRKQFNIPLFQYSDIPVKQEYVQSLKDNGIAVISKSRWFNSVSATLTEEQIALVKSMPFVSGIEGIDKHIIITSNNTELAPEKFHIAMLQMESNEMLKNNLTGKGVVVGVIDAGFYRSANSPFLTHLFEENKVLGQRDFIDPTRKDLVNSMATDSDYHGTTVLEMIAGYSVPQKAQKGLAVNSKFYLARTENGAREYRGEEDMWVEAVEWMDSLGVRLISTSLGYAINMDDPKENYKPEEMDGKTTRISKAAQMAYQDKGIFLVVSAGNEGSNSNWKIISSPADAEGVLSVGATRDKHWDKINYSSIGPEFLPYLKPNVSCYSPNGTSFSAPAVTGFVACLMEKAPNLSNTELKKIIEMSGHLYPFGNNYIGYGVPLASKAIKLIDEKGKTEVSVFEKHIKGKKIKVKMDKNLNAEGVAFHKKDATNVIDQEVVTIRKGKLQLKRSPNVKRTTLSFGTEAIEIYWE
ncbi:MAG: S8 family serine peptidase [Cytophagaceae bacterium]